MKRVKETLTAATTAALVTGCGIFGGQENQTSPNDPVLEQLFEQTKHYWVDQGIGAVANTKLVTLREPGDKFYCNHSEDSPERVVKDVLRHDDYSTVARYCKGEDTVVIIGDSYGWDAEGLAESDTISAQAYGGYIAAHELGHEVTWAKAGVPPDNRASELRADCAAGAALAGMGVAEIPALLQSTMLWEHAHETATGSEQAAAFTAGVADPSGESCFFYYDPADLLTSTPSS